MVHSVHGARIDRAWAIFAASVVAHDALLPGPR